MVCVLEARTKEHVMAKEKESKCIANSSFSCSLVSVGRTVVVFTLNGCLVLCLEEDNKKYTASADRLESEGGLGSPLSCELPGGCLVCWLWVALEGLNCELPGSCLVMKPSMDTVRAVSIDAVREVTD